MLYEYALEPTALGAWQSVRYFLEAFGPWRGRFLFRYPDKKWERMVLDALTCGEIEKHKITEKLRQLDKSVFSPRRAFYDKAQSWRSNAAAEHLSVRGAFRAVIVADPPSADAFVEADTVTDDHPLWRVEPGSIVARDPAVFAQTLGLLLRCSSHLVVVDPFFRADQWDKLEPVVHLCRVMAGRNVVIDVHGCDRDIGHQEFVRLAQRAVPQTLPRGMTVTFRSWSERKGGHRFHNRYVLTDVGGVQFGDSIERGEGGQFDRLSLLGPDERLRLWNLFYGAAPAFDLAGETKVASTT